MSERNRNVWAPWRMEYIRSLGDELDRPDCFLCDYAGNRDKDEQNFVLWRAPSSLVVLNRYPYTNGHLMVAPIRHAASMSDLSDDELGELVRLARDSLHLLGATIHAEGFNVGMNFGRCAGAGLPDHLHVHVVPRWNGDTNFMSTLGDTRIVSQALEELYVKLRAQAAGLGLPKPVTPGPT
jgi:ATP adenylyltransferase